MFVLIGVSWHSYVNINSINLLFVDVFYSVCCQEYEHDSSSNKASEDGTLLKYYSDLFIFCYNIFYKISRSYTRNIVISNLAASYDNSQLSRNHLPHCKH